jgi:predicted transposase/invertase (TIGR01784 family)
VIREIRREPSFGQLLKCIALRFSFHFGRIGMPCVIEKANMTEEERDMYNQLQKAKDIQDSVLYTAQIEGERIGKARGERIGKIEERLTIARNALHMGMTIADISQLTGLTEDEIRKLAH